jgi:hypothetical protein
VNLLNRQGVKTSAEEKDYDSGFGRSEDHLFRPRTMSLRPVLDFLVFLLGGAIVLSLVILGILLSLTALLSLCNERSFLFYRVSRFLGFAIAIFTLTFPFRSVSIFGMLLSVIWAALLIRLQFAKSKDFWTAAVVFIASLVFWFSAPGARNTALDFIIGDLMIFAFLPFAFALVHASRGSDRLIGDRNHSKGPLVPLSAGIAALADLLASVFPPTASRIVE